MSTLTITPLNSKALAQEYALLTIPAERSALYGEWLRRYGDDTAYDLFLSAIALITWPAEPSTFRAQWSAPTVRDSEIRETVTALTDDQLRSISDALRATYERAPSEIPHTWHLARQMAGLA